MYERLKGFLHKCAEGAKTSTVNSLAWVMAVVVCGYVWWNYTYIINHGFDWNLSLIKDTTGLLPEWYGDKAESFARAFNAEKAFLVWEVKTLVRLILLVLGRTFRSALARAWKRTKNTRRGRLRR